MRPLKFILLILYSYSHVSDLNFPRKIMINDNLLMDQRIKNKVFLKHEDIMYSSNIYVLKLIFLNTVYIFH